MDPRLDASAVVAGFVWGILVGGPVVSVVMARLHRVPLPGAEGEKQLLDAPPSEGWHREGLGIVERSLTVIAVLLKAPEVVAAWLVFKTANSWWSWKKAPGVFNRYAIGTGLSLAFGASGGALALALSAGNHLLALGVMIGPLVLAVLVLTTSDSAFRWFWAPTEKLRR